MNVTFTPKALTQYIDWQTEDKKTIAVILMTQTGWSMIATIMKI